MYVYVVWGHARKETATLFAKESRRGRKSHRKPPASIPTNRRPVEYHCSKSQHGSIRLLSTKSTHPSDTPAMCVPPTRSLSAIDHAAEVLESELESDRSFGGERLSKKLADAQTEWLSQGMGGHDTCCVIHICSLLSHFTRQIKHFIIRSCVYFTKNSLGLQVQGQ